MTILLHALEWDPAPWLALVAKGAPGRKVVTATDEASLAGVRYAMVWKPVPGVLARCPRLEVIFNLGAGVDAILKDTSIPPAIPLVRTIDPNLTMRMTEWVCLHVLLHHRRFLAYQAQQKERRWHDIPGQPPARDVTVGILGLGVLGLNAAAALRQIGFRVAGWSRAAKAVEGVACFHGEAGLGPFLGETDILVCLLPLTPETRGFLAYPLFRRLKRGGPLGGPVLLNAGRGGEQVEADIVRALDDGTLIAASLDVFETEPLPAASPLWAHPRVLVSPHNAADSEPAALTAYVLEQIAAHEAGRGLRNVVDRSRGY